ncbi:DMT family transporter [Rossellomorea aquimaris]|uniref:DMT family transporter n=1 Tax=Rossellomorea aquimaris TaxID=189382 RepID=UPI001CFF33CE|nr:DMT family transporter [Rossellomorea aquimaris]
MKKFLIYIIALIAGMALSIEGAIYGELGKSVGKLESSFYNFFTGSIILGLALLFFGKGKLSYTFKAPKWNLLGGILGVVYLTILVISIPIVGVGLSMVSVILGQMAMSILIEHFGWLGSRKNPVNLNQLLAVGFMSVALLLIF